MSRILVFGAAGRAGRAIVDEARSRNHAVVAVTRQPNPDLDAIAEHEIGDATDAASVAALLEKYQPEAVVVAVGGAGRELYRKAAETVLHAAEAAPTAPFVVHFGGGASLTTPDGTKFVDLPQFPREFLDPAVGQSAALDVYRESGYNAWTYFSPPPVNFFIGERLGQYRVGDDQPVTDSNGDARLSYADAAVAIVDEIETRAHAGRRFTAGY